jgi:hypothetical protein
MGGAPEHGRPGGPAAPAHHAMACLSGWGKLPPQGKNDKHDDHDDDDRSDADKHGLIPLSLRL